MGQPLSGPLQCLHLSSQAAHLGFVDGRVLSLVAEPSLASPCAAVVGALFAERAANAPWRTLAHGGEATGRELFFREAVVDLGAAAAWQARPPWEAMRLDEDDGAWRRGVLPALREGCEALGPDLVWIVPEAAALAEALLAEDSGRERAHDAARRLLGRGPGLTPAGDDVLVGACHAVWALGSNDADCERRCRHVLGEIGGSTTALAAAWLAAAAAGEAVFRWHALLAAAAAGERRALSAAVAGVAAIGASSGRAMLAGFEAVLRRAEPFA